MDGERDISELVKKLMEDDSVRALISSMKNDGDESETETESAPAGEVLPKEDDSTGFSLSPEMLAKLPQVMSALSGISGAAASGGGSAAKSGGGGRMADRKKLLLALKPFLSRRRCEAIDSIVNIAGLGDILKLM